jgi:hypothetical protein
MMSSPKPLCHNGFRPNRLRAVASARTRRTVLKTVEVIPPWVRIPLPPRQKPSYSLGFFASGRGILFLPRVLCGGCVGGRVSLWEGSADRVRIPLPLRQKPSYSLGFFALVVVGSCV